MRQPDVPDGANARAFNQRQECYVPGSPATAAPPLPVQTAQGQLMSKRGRQRPARAVQTNLCAPLLLKESWTLACGKEGAAALVALLLNLCPSTACVLLLADLASIAQRMASVKHKILVLSGKGGVGKSTFSAQLAFALAAQGKEVGLLDIDICGPSIPKMLGLEGQEVHQSNAGWSPVYVEDNLAVMSIGFLLPSPDEAVIWRGPRKNGLIKQFLKDVLWGELDYLVVDAPPGTSDEHITIAQCLNASPTRDGAIIVTTPQPSLPDPTVQEVSIIDVRKEISFCRKVGLQVLGVVENMAGLQVPASALRFIAKGQLTEPLTASPMAGIEAGLEREDLQVPSPALQQPPKQPEGEGGGIARGAGGGGGGGGGGQEEDVTEQVMAVLRSHFPHLHQLYAHAEVFKSDAGGAARMCKDMGVVLLGRVPLDPMLTQAAESGMSIFEAAAEGQASGVRAGAGALGQVLPPVCVPALQAIVQRVMTGLAKGVA
ncbi:hypothetical protein QJQ45_026796 [Haematococcus lacustris]|nr:hypothetical protein QJQ45_026796 [Haematococcus lacustris]